MNETDKWKWGKAIICNDFMICIIGNNRAIVGEINYSVLFSIEICQEFPEHFYLQHNKPNFVQRDVTSVSSRFPRYTL